MSSSTISGIGEWLARLVDWFSGVGDDPTTPPIAPAHAVAAMCVGILTSAAVEPVTAHRRSLVALSVGAAVASAVRFAFALRVARAGTARGNVRVLTDRAWRCIGVLYASVRPPAAGLSAATALIAFAASVAVTRLQILDSDSVEPFAIASLGQALLAGALHLVHTVNEVAGLRRPLIGAD